jgi:hypothetical protein
MVVALGLAAPLALSGVIEAFVTPCRWLPVKLAIGACAWLGFLGYADCLRVSRRAGASRPTWRRTSGNT